MSRKPILFLFAALITLALASCLPQTALEPQQQPPAAATAVPGSTATLADIIHTPVLEPLTPTRPAVQVEQRIPAVDTPATEMILELVMPEETTTPTGDPAGEETKEAAANQALPTAVYPAEVQPLIDKAVADLAGRLSLDPQAITVLSFASKVWPDSSVGCPQPGMNYLQVLTEGYLIQLRVGDQIYNYHGGGRREPFLCEQPAKPLKVTKPAPLELNPKQTPTKSIPPSRD